LSSSSNKLPTCEAWLKEHATKEPSPKREHSVARRIQSNVLWAGVGCLLSITFLLMLHALLARFLSAEDCRRYIILESMTLVPSVLVMAGLPSVSLRMLRKQLILGNGADASKIVKDFLGIMVGSSALTGFGVFAFAILTLDHAFGRHPLEMGPMRACVDLIH
jgi:hypothetical protein